MIIIVDESRNEMKIFIDHATLCIMWHVYRAVYIKAPCGLNLARNYMGPLKICVVRGLRINHIPTSGRDFSNNCLTRFGNYS